jgi:hypothetical protein
MTWRTLLKKSDSSRRTFPRVYGGCGDVIDCLSQKIRKSWKRSLTVWRGGDYIRLNNEGGAPLAAPEFAPKEPGSLGKDFREALS